MLLVFFKFLFNYYFYIFLISIEPNVFCLEKICGEYISNSVRLQVDSKKSSTKGIFNSLDINNEINELNKKNITEPTLCIYKFIANKNEKVLIKFDNFDIKSLAPDCIHEYVDIYIELNNQTIDNYLESNFLSRWCGWKKPSLLISYHNVILFVYHTDGRFRGSSFSGTYEFISSEPFDKGKVSESKCEYEFKSSVEKSGHFMSPTYPGTYPNVLDCSYKFIGEPNERVSIYFEEISIHLGGDHCPYDAVKVFDINKINTNNLQTSYEDLIQTYCGIKKGFTVYSANSSILLKFETSDSLGNDEYSDDETKILLRRGFKAFYRFSKDYVNLSFITGEYIRGTYCDQRFVSTGDSNGIIYSPNFSNFMSIDAVCQYIFEGLNDNEYFESVKLKFYSYLDLNSENLSENCNRNNGTYLAVYEPTKSKQKYCLSNEDVQSNEIRSSNSYMVLRYYSTNGSSRFGFIANYTFFTEFGIVGTRVYPNRTCLFLYNSKTLRHGNINSPRYPKNYPLNTECVYIFDILPNERLLLTFRELKLAQVVAPNDKNECSTSDDHLSIYQIINHDSHENGITNSNSIQRFCGTHKIPSPIISDSQAQSLKIHFYSNEVNIAQGFYLNYMYLQERVCKYNVTPNGNVSNGSIMITQEIESFHTCEWHISVNGEQSILFMIRTYNLSEDNCINFILSIYDINNPKHPVYEYCITNGITYFQVDSSNVKIKLTSGESFQMKSGKIVINWITGVKKDENNCENKFICKQSNYCIDSNYFCDKIPHCNDTSDEPPYCNIPDNRSPFPLYHTLIILTMIIIFIIISSIFIACKLNIIKKSQKKKRIQYVGQPVFYKYSPTNSMDYLEAAITSV